MQDDVWPYLSSEPYLVRHAMAAYLLRDCSEILEIGGHKITMADFVTDKPVTIVGPECQQKSLPNVKYLRKYFQDWKVFPSKFKDFGLVMLGFEMFGLSDEDWARMYRFVNKSNRTVIELAQGLEHSEKWFADILSGTNKRVTARWEIHVEDKQTAYWNVRMMHLLE